MKTNKTILGVVTGIAIGATIGILFAPDKGTKTRKKIAKKSNDLKDNLKDEFDKFLETASDKYNQFTGKGEELLDKGIKTVNEIENSLK